MPRRGLILHDDASLRSSVESTMLTCGFQSVEDVTAASAAIEMATRTQPDAIVIDIDLAGSRGVRIVAELLQAVPGASIIVMSQFAAIRYPALEAGACAFIGKADLRELRRCLRRIEKATSSPSTGSEATEGQLPPAT